MSTVDDRSGQGGGAEHDRSDATELDAQVSAWQASIRRAKADLYRIEAARERAEAARERAEAARQRAQAARERADRLRGQLVELSVPAPDDWERRAEERELTADEREREADERERQADERDRRADERESEADEREAGANRSERGASAESDRSSLRPDRLDGGSFEQGWSGQLEDGSKLRSQVAAIADQMADEAESFAGFLESGATRGDRERRLRIAKTERQIARIERRNAARLRRPDTGYLGLEHSPPLSSGEPQPNRRAPDDAAEPEE